MNEQRTPEPSRCKQYLELWFRAARAQQRVVHVIAPGAAFCCRAGARALRPVSQRQLRARHQLRTGGDGYEQSIITGQMNISRATGANKRLGNIRKTVYMQAIPSITLRKSLWLPAMAAAFSNLLSNDGYRNTVQFLLPLSRSTLDVTLRESLRPLATGVARGGSLGARRAEGVLEALRLGLGTLLYPLWPPLLLGGEPLTPPSAPPQPQRPPRCTCPSLSCWQETAGMVSKNHYHAMRLKMFQGALNAAPAAATLHLPLARLRHGRCRQDLATTSGARSAVLSATATLGSVVLYHDA